jgi:hypothetical protein
VFDAAKCSTVTIIVDTYLHIELNFVPRRRAPWMERAEAGGKSIFADNFAIALLRGKLNSFTKERKGAEDMICISTRFFTPLPSRENANEIPAKSARGCSLGFLHTFLHPLNVLIWKMLKESQKSPDQHVIPKMQIGLDEFLIARSTCRSLDEIKIRLEAKHEKVFRWLRRERFPTLLRAVFCFVLSFLLFLHVKTIPLICCSVEDERRRELEEGNFLPTCSSPSFMPSLSAES